MVLPHVEGIDLFNIAGRSISGWIKSLKTGTTVRRLYLLPTRLSKYFGAELRIFPAFGE